MSKETYELRNLKTSDIFKMSKILKKMDINIEIKEGMSQNQVGFEMINEIFSNLHLAEKEVSEFMGDLVGISGKEFDELPINVTAGIISQFKDLDGVESFLKLANK